MFEKFKKNRSLSNANDSIVSENNSDYVIEMRHITKEFPGIIANDDITLQLKRGEIHALLGETAPENPR